MSFWHWLRGHRVQYRNITVKGIVMGQDKVCSCGQTKDDVVTMPNQPPLNPDALEAAADAVIDASFGQELPEAPIDLATAAVSAYLAAAQPEVSSFDPRVLNRKGWTCGCEPGNYDSCDECQSACNELANFLNCPEVSDA